MRSQVPEKMLAVRQHEADGGLSVESIPVPQPGPGEVLVRMAASPINPSDLALLKGDYLKRNYPFTPGLEGSGMVVGSGGGFLASMRKGKRVACTPLPGGDGTWAEYLLTSAMRTIPLPASLSMEKGSMLVVNPMTAMALLHLAKIGNHRAMVNTAAASSLGKMLIRLTEAKGIPLINIVRKRTQEEELKKMGSTYVLNSQDKTFESDLTKLAAGLGATLFLDAIAGSQSGLLLRAAPPSSTLLTYARLSGDPMDIDPGLLIKEGKQISGFQLGNWLESKGMFFKLGFVNRVKKQLGSALTSQIHQTFTLNEVDKAIGLYVKNMSKGKIILKLTPTNSHE